MSCYFRENAFWLNTNCSDSVNTFCPPGTDDDKINETCLCPASNCSVIGSIDCRGTPYYLTENGGSYLSFKSVSNKRVGSKHIFSRYMSRPPQQLILMRFQFNARNYLSRYDHQVLQKEFYLITVFLKN